MGHRSTGSRSTTSPWTAPRSAPPRPRRGLELDGFRITTGSEDVRPYLHAYFVQNRQYVNLDRTLDHLYNFAGFANRPNWVDWFRNDPGALISYWDTS